MTTLPTGTVTFLLTDIEGSTRLWQEKPQAMTISHPRHDAILRQAIEGHHGYVYQIIGDSFCAAFHNAFDGLCATLSAQLALHSESWGESGEIRVRMGLHTGSAEISTDGSQSYSDAYTTLATTQRVMSAAYGGQVLISQTTYDLIGEHLPENVSLRNMGEHRLKDLRSPMHLYQLVTPGLPRDFPAIKSLSTIPNNLPLQLSSFIGREKEIAEIKGLLRSARLVTLTGSGGTGKTRLSQEAAAEVLPAFTQGVWLAELASLTDPAQIIPAMAQTFGLQSMPFIPQLTQVMDYLRDKQSLLILDNCEHLIEACARLVDHLLHQCSELKIIASSREPLGVAGEVVYRTPPLMETESTQLFVERARLANPQFKPTETNAKAIAQICARLDGIPLAIELAAARSRMLSPEQLATRLNDRFRLLVGGSRTALPRQQTLRALIDWSYDLLTEGEQQLLRTASVFIGGWTLDALEAVSGDPQALEHLEQLINKSLVIADVRENEMRYSMLETIRQYAREKLFDVYEAPTTRDQHFFYFDHLSEEMWENFCSLNEYSLLRDSAYDELENFRLALEWGLEKHVETALHLAGNFNIASSWIGNQIEGLALLKLALERFKALPPVEGEAAAHRQRLLAKTMFSEGMTSMATGGVSHAIQSLREAISMARQIDDKRLLGYSLEMLYTASAFNDALRDADDVEEGYRIFSQLDDKWGKAMSYMNMARVAAARGNLSESQMYFGVLKELTKDAPMSFQTGMFCLSMGYTERFQGHPEIAKGYFEQGLIIFKQLRHKGFETVMLSELGHIARVTGNLAQAKQVYQQTILRYQDMGNRGAIAHQLECFAFIALGEGELLRAAKLFGSAESLREGVNSQMTEREKVEYDQEVARLRSLLAESEFSSYWSDGRSMTMENAIDYALS